jgi:uncharacterized protein YhfF
MVKFLIYILIIYIVFLVIRTFRKLKASSTYKPGEGNKIRDKYRNIEEADYKEIKGDSKNKTDQE